MGQVFGWTLILPSFITSTLSVMSFVTSELIWVFLGLYLHAMQLLIWVVQTYLESMRVNPICQQYQTYAFPSIVAYYAISLATFVILYAYFWGVAHSVLAWIVLYGLIFVPPLALVGASYNTTSEVLISMIIGIAATTAFVVVLRVYIKPTLPYLVNDFPCSLLGYVDTYITDCDAEREECKRCAEALDRNIAAVPGF